MSTESSPWYKVAFSDLYRKVYAHRTIEEAQQHLPFLFSTAQLDPCPGLVLDLGCGTGRYAHLLKQKGISVIGLDYSQDLLAQARKDSSELPLIRGTMLQLPFQNSFSRVLSLFTSFGYFLSDYENSEVLGQMSGALQRNGLLYLDYLNPLPVSEAPWSDIQQGEYCIRSRKIIDTKNHTVVKSVTILKDSELLSSYEERVKLYSPQWFNEEAPKYGLKLRNLYGDYEGNPPTDTSPRRIYLFEKVS